MIQWWIVAVVYALGVVMGRNTVYKNIRCAFGLHRMVGDFVVALDDKNQPIELAESTRHAVQRHCEGCHFRRTKTYAGKP